MKIIALVAIIHMINLGITDSITGKWKLINEPELKDSDIIVYNFQPNGKVSLYIRTYSEWTDTLEKNYYGTYAIRRDNLLTVKLEEETYEYSYRLAEDTLTLTSRTAVLQLIRLPD